MVVSDTVKEYYKNGSHGKLVTISFPDLDYTVPSENVYFESLDLEEAIFDGDSFEAVGCIASKFEISIRDFGEDVKGQKITADIDLVDVEDSTIRLFTGIVDSVQMESNKQVKKLTAYDALYALGNTDVAEWYKSLVFPMSVGAFRHSLCSHIGLNEVSGTLPNDSISINKQYNPNTLNALDLLKNICQINGVFGIINRQGYMEYRVPSASTAEEIPYTRSIEYQEYLVDPVDKLTIRQDQDSPGVSYGTGNNNYIIQGNFFTYGLSPETVYDIARNMYSNVSSFTYRPFKASNNGLPFIELGLNNSVAYRVYDFENSSSGHDVYKNITVIVMSRHLKGIQSIVDDYEAKGNEDQRLFISDLGTEIQALKETIENLDKATSTEISVYRNQSPITIYSCRSGVISDIAFSAERGNTVVFHEELSLIANAREIIGAEAYAEYDPEILVKYVLNGVELKNHISNGCLFDGKNIVHLMQFWKAGINTNYRLQTVLYAINGDIQIARFNANAYITVRTSEFEDFQIVVTTEPTKTSYITGEALDFTGLVICKVYYDDSTPPVDITSLCEIRPAAGTVYTEPTLVTIDVLYQEENESGELIDYTTQFYCGYDYGNFTLELTEPTKTEYFVGDPLDYTGLVVMKVYDDSTKPSVDVTSLCIITPTNGTVYYKRGSVKVDVVYPQQSAAEPAEGQSESFYCDYEYPEFELSISQPPNKTHYDGVDNQVDYTGLVVIATYENGEVVDVTDRCTYSLADGDIISEDTDVDVSYTDDSGATDSADFALYYDVVDYIEVVQPPTITTYYVNEYATASLDYTGLRVEAVYTNSRRKNITAQCTMDPSEGTVYTYEQEGDIDVSVVYNCPDGTFDDSFTVSIVYRIAMVWPGRDFGGFIQSYVGSSASRYITAIERSTTPPPVPTALTIAAMPTKTSYVIGEALNYDGISVIANFTNHDPFDCTTECTFSPTSGSTVSSAGTVIVTVSYKYDNQTVTTTFNLIVVEG